MWWQGWIDCRRKRQLGNGIRENGEKQRFKGRRKRKHETWASCFNFYICHLLLHKWDLCSVVNVLLMKRSSTYVLTGASYKLLSWCDESKSIIYSKCSIKVLNGDNSVLSLMDQEHDHNYMFLLDRWQGQTTNTQIIRSFDL